MHVGKTKSVCHLIFYVFVVTAISHCSSEDKAQAAAVNSPAATLLDEKLKHYNLLYPDIQFINFSGGDETNEDMLALDLLLGYAPISLDYEHPAKLREDLIYVSASRILLMLESQSPSASLFRAEHAYEGAKNICVLTIDADEVAADTSKATQHLLHPVLYEQLKIPEKMRLLADEYLAFVIDHEVYHCLRSMYIGPQLMSDKELWGEYNNFLGDQGADVYALLMHYKTRKQVSAFPENIIRMRGMSLYNADPDHLTYSTLEQVIKLQTEKITRLDDKDIFNMAYRIKKKTAIDYDEYKQYLASAIEAMKRIGVNAKQVDELYEQVKDIKADPLMVRQLVSNSRHCLEQLNGM